MIIKCDVLIIGAGPAGLFALFQCGLLNLDAVLVDGCKEIGGQCSAMYPDKPIYDIPCFQEVSGRELVNRLEKQISRFSPRIVLDTRIEMCEKSEDHIKAYASNGSILFYTKKVIAASGRGAISPRRIPIEGIETFENTSVFYTPLSPKTCIGKRIAIVGGGDSAVDAAIELSETAAEVHFIHRRDGFKCAPSSKIQLEKLFEENRVKKWIPFALDSIQGNSSTIQKIAIKHCDSEKEILIKVDIINAFFGLSAQKPMKTNCDLKFDLNNKITVNPLNMESSVKNIYAIGDACSHAQKHDLIVMGFSEAVIACRHIHSDLFPELSSKLKQHSTTTLAPLIKNKEAVEA